MTTQDEDDSKVSVFVRPDGWFGLRPAPATPQDERPTVEPIGLPQDALEAFAQWLARVGPQRICDGSGMRDGARHIACPGCAACCTSATTCPAFWDEPSVTGCVFCGGGADAHRKMPPLPVGAVRLFASLEPSPEASLILRDPR